MGEARSIQTGQAFVSRAGSHGFYKEGNFSTSCVNYRRFKETPALELACSTATRETGQQRIVTQPRRGSPERGEVLQLCTPGPPAKLCACCWMVQMQFSM